MLLALMLGQDHPRSVAALVVEIVPAAAVHSVACVMNELEVRLAGDA